MDFFVIRVIRSWLLIVLSVVSFNAIAQNSNDSNIIDTSKKSDTLRYLKTYKSSFDKEVKYNASDSIIVKLKEKRVYLYGNAQMIYGDLDIRAAAIWIDFNKSEMMALPYQDSLGKESGFPIFKEKDKQYQAKLIKYNYKSKRGYIKELITEEAEGLVTGERVAKDEDNNMYIRNARYTTCTDTTDPHFYIQANKMKVIPGKKIISGPAYFYVGNIPLPAVLPFGFFPISKGRSSGLIMPTYGYADTRGFNLRNGGLYLGLSDYFDMALTGDIYTNLSWRGNVTSSYAKRYKFSGNLSLEYAKNKNGAAEDIDYNVFNSFFVRWSHSMDMKARPNTTFNANVNLGSSNFLQLNSYNPAAIVQNTLNSSVNYNKVFNEGKSSLGMGFSHSQNTQTGQVSLTLPNLTYDVSRFFPFKAKEKVGSDKWYEQIGVNYQASFRNQINTVDSMFSRPELLVNQFQYGVLHTLPIQSSVKLFKYLNLTPALNINAYNYLSSTSKTWDAQSNRVVTDTVQGFVTGYSFETSANFSTILYGTVNFKKGKVQAIRHVMTTNIGFSYRPDFSEDKYGFYKKVQADSAGTNFQTYSIFEQGIFGGPGRGENGSINLNFGNNLEMKVRKMTDSGWVSEKIKIFDFFNFGASYNFLAETKPLSAISFNTQTTLFKQLSLQLGGSLDPYALDSLGVSSDKYLILTEKKLARLTNFRVAMNTGLNPDMFKKDKKGTPRFQQRQRAFLNSQELAMLQMPGGYVDFNIPWNLNLSYIFVLNRFGFETRKEQTLNLNGDFKLTEKWKIGFSSGYDFVRKQVSLTTLDFYRDLHCWEFRFNWMPFGERRYFNFGINAKSSVLQDLKLNRRRDWFDR